MKDKFFDIDAVDFDDENVMDKLSETRSKQWIILYARASKGDQKALEALREHEKLDRELKKRARASGYYWI